MTTRIELSGGFQLVRDGASIAIPYVRARALLAFLALEPGPHARERLADLLWSEDDAEGGRNNLRRMLTLLRKALGPDQAALRADRNTIALVMGENIHCDVAEFFAPVSCQDNCTSALRTACIEQAEQVQSLYRGPLLAGIDLADELEFENWLSGQRMAFQRQAQIRQDKLIGCLEKSGNLPAAIYQARRQIELAPDNEAAYRRLIELLAHNGQQAEALAQFESCCQYLATELDVTPSNETLDLIERLKAGQESAMQPMVNQPHRLPVAIVCLRPPADNSSDPDSHAEAIDQALVRYGEQVEHAGGVVGASMAGMLIAWFGFPAASEHATRAATSCALKISQDGAAAGVESGMVICDLAGKRADLGGQLTRTCMQLAERAMPGQVLLGGQAAKIGATTLSLRALDHTAYLVSGSVSPAQAHDEPLLGRTEEYCRLLNTWEAVKRGDGRGLLVRGEAGIGKTSLVSRLYAQAGHHLRCHCYPEREHTPFKPIIHLLLAALDIAETAKADFVQMRVSERFSRLPQAARLQLTELIAHHQTATLPPSPTARQALINALAAAFSSLAQSRPLLLWLEDAHWADTSTLAVLAGLASARPPGLLLLITARPLFQPDWPIEMLDLPLLPPEHSHALAHRLAEGQLTAEQIDGILVRAEGIPLFIQELIRIRLMLGEQQLPATLAELLSARLHSVPEALPVAQLAAVAGRQFDRILLEQAGIAPANLHKQLELLLRTGLIKQEAHSRLSFTHALLQEAAYQSMAATTRRTNHALIAQTLLTNEPSLAEHDPGLLAWHFAHAGHGEETLSFSLAAARQALNRHALREAQHHLKQALTYLDLIPAGAERNSWELNIQLMLAPILGIQHGYGAQPVREAYEKAQRLDDPEADSPHKFPLIWGLWLGSSSWSTHEKSLELAHRLVALAKQRPDDPFAICHAYSALGNGLYCHGNFAAAVAALEQGLTHYLPSELLSPYGEDPAVTSLAFLSWSYWHLGRNEDALAATARSLELAARIGQPHTFCYASIFATITYRLLGDIDNSRNHAANTYRVGCEHDLALWIAAGQLMLGWAKAAGGDQAGLAEMLNCVESIRQIMVGIETMFLSHLADACERSGAWQQALEAAEMGLHMGKLKCDRHYEAEFLRVKACALAHLGRGESEHLLEQAQALAKSQGSLAVLARIERCRRSMGIQTMS